MACDQNQKEEKSEYNCECGQPLINKNNRIIANIIESGDHIVIIACTKCKKQHKVICNACKAEQITPITIKT